MTTTPRWRQLVSLLVASALVLVSCGDDDTTAAAEAEEPEVTTTVMAASVDVEATVDEFLTSIPEGWLSVKAAEDVVAARDTGNALLIDVREASEYDEGHIPGAVNIPIRELTKHLDAIPMDQQVVVYCKSGYRAAMATAALQTLGYDNVKAFGGSYKAWTAAEQDVSTEAVALPTGVAPDFEPDLLAAVEDFLLVIPEGYQTVGPVEKMQAAMDAGAFLIDVREPGEYAEGRIPGAVNMPLRTLMAGVEDIPDDVQVVVYCKSGYRAGLANAALTIAGLDNVVAFSPSYAGWTDAGMDVET
jgi:rhodanese-related sulfurtransferase